MTLVTCSLTAKNRDQLRNPTLGNRVWATFTFTFQTFADVHDTDFYQHQILLFHVISNVVLNFENLT